MTENPIICSQNRIDSDTIFDENGSPTSYTERLYDRDRDTQWQSGTITAERYLQMVFAQTITLTFIVLNNHNLKDFHFEYWTGSTYADITETITTNNTKIDNNFEFSEKSTTKIKLKFSAVQSGTVALIGEIFLLKKELEFEYPPQSYEPEVFKKQEIYRLGQGTMKFWWEYAKYRARLTLVNLSKTTVDVLKTYYDSQNPFVFIPEPTARPEHTFLVHLINYWTAIYSTEYKGAGYTFPIEVEEV